MTIIAVVMVIVAVFVAVVMAVGFRRSVMMRLMCGSSLSKFFKTALEGSSRDAQGKNSKRDQCQNQARPGMRS